MRYGFCTGFATDPLFSSLEAAVSLWGFDYIEYPLMSIAALSEADFSNLRERLQRAHLACDCMCNLFPASVPVIGERVNEKQIREYLDTAFGRAAILGVKKLIFGSAGARKRGGLAKETADRQFLASLLILEEYCSRYRMLLILEEYCSRYRMQVLLEAIRVGEADYINTLSEGAEMVILAQKAGCTHIALMADLFHMNSNGEDCLDLKKYFPLIRHIHICETERKLPSQPVSDSLRQETELLQSLQYNLTASYESIMPVNDAQGKQALSLLKSMLHESPQE